MKASLHIHTKEDFLDGGFVKYSIIDLIDIAHFLNFDVLALTGHFKYVYREEFGAYAQEKGMILIPGIELMLGKWFEKHVIILNCGKDAERLKDFEDIRAYKRDNPHVFVIAPHPNLGIFESIGTKNLLKYIDLFDAIEHSWFYSPLFNRNRKLEEIALKYGKPMLATADLHTLDYLDSDYVIVDAEERNIPSFFSAIKAGKYENITAPKRFSELVAFYLKLKLEDIKGGRNPAQKK